MTIKNLILKHKRWIKYFSVALAYSILIYLLWTQIPEHYRVDWNHGFYPATRKFFSGQSPYEGTGVFNPPWTFLLLAPFAILPVKIGAILLTLVNFLSFFFITKRLKASTLIASVFLFTPQLGFKIIGNPNIDFLAVFGFLLPPQIGLFFLTIKPQIGIAVAIFWLIESWRRGGLKEIFRVFSPVIAAFLLSILIYGPYFTRAQYLIESDWVWWRYPLWPYAIAVGLTLLVMALRNRRIQTAITASPFLSPYVASYSFPIGLLGLVDDALLFFPAFVGVWVTYLLLR